MKVQCRLCEHEKNSFCSKKKQGGVFKKIKANKRRTCKVYSEDPLLVLGEYRKREAHKKLLQRQEQRRIYTEHALRELKERAAKVNSSGEK